MPSQPSSRPISDSEVIAFLQGRSLPCPRCNYDLRDIQTPICPECAEPLILKVGSPRVRFGYFILAMAPGCFSGVAACFVAVPVLIHLWMGTWGKPRGMPWPVIFADLFGFLSAAAVVAMYRRRHIIMHWPDKRQLAFAGAMWLIHILAFASLLGSMLYWYN